MSGTVAIKMATMAIESGIKLVNENKLLVTVAVGAFGLSYMMLNKRRDLPPGPIGWPVIGESMLLISHP